MGWNAIDHFLAKWRSSKVVGYIPNGSIVLDFGCGEGQLLFGIKDRISKGIGIDRKVRNIENSKITLINADLEKNIPAENEFFDVVIALAVLEHLNNSLNAASEVHRVLKKGGKFILTLPTPQSKPLLEFLAFRLGVICKEEVADHKYYWDKEGIIRLLKNVGFKEVNHKYFQFGFNQFIIATK